jgi:hypothetical protein
LLFFICVLCFCCANIEEPVLGHKELFLDRLSLPFIESKQTIVKPAHSTSVGMGVDFKSSEWTRNICEDTLGVPCMEQPYHEGPWEVRLYKSNCWDKEAVAWNVPCTPPECLEPFPFLTRFPWQKDLEDKIDQVLPHSSFLAVDARTNGRNVLVLEINGAFGMPYHWATQSGHSAVVNEHVKWFADRVRAGAKQFSLTNLLKLLFLAIERQAMKKVKGKIWF